MTKKVWKAVSGVLLLDKPEGMTSNTALQKARRIFSAAKAGHTGTLDPMATGLLPLCFGEATKFSADLLEADKIYEAELTLGITTDTGDKEGQVCATAPVLCTEQDILAVLPRFTGPILQTPPMYSALKRNGIPLHQLARQGIEVERSPRPVTIHHIHLLDCQLPAFRLEVACSKGTYIRVLAEDIGRALGCGAHLTALRRTVVGPLSVAASHTLENLGSFSEEKRPACLAPVDSLLTSLPSIHLLIPEDIDRFCHGNPVRPKTDLIPVSDMLLVRVNGVDRFLGTGYLKPDGKVWPKRLVVQ